MKETFNEASRGTFRVLLVEDDEDDFIITRHLLEEAYGSVLSLEWASTWDEALVAIEDDSFDIFFVDYHLGSHNGVELVGESVGRGHSTPIVMLTGHDSRDIDLAALSAGAAEYLVKSELTASLIERTARYAIEHKKAELRLTNLAHHDALTDLANRTLFRERLVTDISHTKRNGRQVAVLLFDLDNFKDVNDTLGHPVGDLLLKQIAQRLNGAVRSTDLVARLGGDEFAIIATHLRNEVDANELAEKVAATLAKPCIVDGHELFVTSSIGIAMYPDDGGDPDALLKNADLALYVVKKQGRNGVRFFDPQMNAEAQARKAVETAMRTGLDAGEFSLHFQPKVEFATGRVSGVEALVRWQHPSRGLLLPDEFIPVAESTGLIVPLGERVFQEACLLGVAWRDAGLPPISVAVNLSVAQIRRVDCAEVLLRAVRETGAETSWLEVEITESVIMDERESTMRLLARFRELGVRIAVDDFGTGYSSLAYLKHFPVDTLKIDRSFVTGVDVDASDAAICRAIIQLGDSLNLDVVAEGVETSSQAAFLRQHGAKFGQGNYFCPPLAAGALIDWYATIAASDHSAPAA